MGNNASGTDAQRPLADTAWVVAGGTGAAGTPIVAELLDRGARVVVPSRAATRLTALRTAVAAPIDSDRGRRLVGVVDDITGPDPAELARVLDDEPVQLCGAVASLGGWWEGAPLHQLDPQVWDRIVQANLTAHVRFAQFIISRLLDQPDSVLVLLGGVAATKPVAGSAPISITGAAQRMLAGVLRAEVGDRLRVHELEVMRPIDPITGRPPDETRDTLPAGVVADAVVDLLMQPVPGNPLVVSIPVS